MLDRLNVIHSNSISQLTYFGVSQISRYLLSAEIEKKHFDF